WWDEAGSLQAVVGLVRGWEFPHVRSPIRAPLLTNIGGGQASVDHQALLSVPAMRSEVAEWLRSRAGWYGVLLRNLDPDAGVPVVTQGARLVARTPCIRLSLAAWREESIPSIGLRKRLRYYRRRLARAGVSLECLEPSEVNESLVVTL